MRGGGGPDSRALASRGDRADRRLALRRLGAIVPSARTERAGVPARTRSGAPRPDAHGQLRARQPRIRLPFRGRNVSPSRLLLRRGSGGGARPRVRPLALRPGRASMPSTWRSRGVADRRDPPLPSPIKLRKEPTAEVSAKAVNRPWKRGQSTTPRPCRPTPIGPPCPPSPPGHAAVVARLRALATRLEGLPLAAAADVLVLVEPALRSFER